MDQEDAAKSNSEQRLGPGGIVTNAAKKRLAKKPLYTEILSGWKRRARVPEGMQAAQDKEKKGTKNMKKRKTSAQVIERRKRKDVKDLRSRRMQRGGWGNPLGKFSKKKAVQQREAPRENDR